jgi:uncharacterized membrane-anchored protein
MNDPKKQHTLSKVPEVTLVSWIIKIAATTLGETGGDTVTMTLNWGYLAGTALFLGLLIVLVVAQFSPTNSTPFSIGRRSSPPRPSAPPWQISPTARSASDTRVARRCCSSASSPCQPLVLVAGHYLREYGEDAKRGGYWAAITFSQTLGTALGDWMAGTGGLGYEGGALVFAAGLAMIVGLYIWTHVSRVLLFWAAFILTRPLGATVGDFLDTPMSQGGLALSPPLLPP